MKQIEDTSLESARKRFIGALVMLGLATIYTISPVDLIPDIIPIAGLLDDIPLLISTAAYAGYSYRKMKKERERNNA
jgi:uncharacterized membrane protein YkvA (DUF1232 family)